jgi:hypothetical protein
VILHVGGASTAAVLVTIVAIFFLIFATSFALGPVPEGRRRFSGDWFGAWFRASLPRLVIAGVFSALLFVGSSLSGGDDATDAQPVPAAFEPCAIAIGSIGAQPLTEERVVAAVAAFDETAELARTGDVGGANAVFLGDAHNISHDIDGPLRDAAPALAVDLCESVLEIEQQFATAADTAVIANESETSARLLEEAGRVLRITE